MGASFIKYFGQLFSSTALLCWVYLVLEMRGTLNGSLVPDGEPERPGRNRWAEDGRVLGIRE